MRWHLAVRRILQCVLLLGITLDSACAAAQTQQFYYFGKGKIPLGVSNVYVAVPLTVDEVRYLNQEYFSTEDAKRQPKATILIGNILLVPRKESKEFGFFRKNPRLLDERAIQVYSWNRLLLIPSDEVIVQFFPKAPTLEIERILAKYSHHQSSDPGRVVIRVRNADAILTANGLAQNPNVQYAEPNFTTLIPAPPPVAPVPLPTIGSAPVALVPSDRYFPLQWFLENRGVGKQGADIRAQQAWKATKGDSVTIAVLDLGVDLTHPDLSPKIVDPYDAITGTNKQDPASSDDYHGTACAGLAASLTDNIVGIASIGWNTKIMPVRMAIFDKLTFTWQTNPSIIKRAIDTAVDKGADVLSNSWSTGLSSDVDAAVDRALSLGRKGKGAVLVFAAGNASSGVDWPANSSLRRSIIAVSATNEWDEFKTKSSQDNEPTWGSNSGPEITVAAPGVHLFTTNLRGGSSANSADYIPNFHGTSAATPIVAGVVALIISVNRNLSAPAVVDVLTKTADHLGTAGRNNEFGYGRVNACRAVGSNGC